MPSEWRQKSEKNFRIWEGSADNETETGRNAVGQGVHIGKFY